MTRPHRHIDVEVRGDVFCVRLRNLRMDEPAIHEMAEELIALATEEECRKLVLSLGPGAPVFLYSVFLSKLLSIQRHLRDQGAEFKLCDVSPEVRNVFTVCRLENYFDFAPDFDAAVAAWSA
jgi:anti-anti-sigma factor